MNQYFMFVMSGIEAAGGMDDYVGTFDSPAVAYRYWREHHYSIEVLDLTPDVGVQLAQIIDGKLAKVAELIATDGETLNDQRNIRLFWQMADGQSLQMETIRLSWKPIDAQEILRGLGLKPGQSVTGYIPPGEWIEGDPF